MRMARDWLSRRSPRDVLLGLLVLQLAAIGLPSLGAVQAADQPAHGTTMATARLETSRPPVASPQLPMPTVKSDPIPAPSPFTVTNTPVTPTPPLAADDPGRYLLDAGDKIRIRIYQREDLSGDYLIDTRGAITLPVLGAFKAAGRDEEQLRADISQAAQKSMVRNFDVVVDVAERRPIYIVGFVEKPGVYPFALRMTVVHAVSMAGGPYRPTAGTRGTEFATTINRIQSDTENLKLVTVRLARLEAERDQRPFSEMPDDLVALAGEVEARDLMTREQRLQASEAEVRVQLLDANKRAREHAKAELEDLHLKIAQIDNQLKLNQTQKTALKTLVSKGFVRTTQVAAIETTDATFSINRLEVLASISRATRTLDDLAADAKTKELARWRELMNEINSLAHQKDALKASVRTARNSVGLTKGQDPFKVSMAGQELLVYSVMRRTPKGYVTFPVDDVTPLQPGDVLKVATLRPEDAKPMVTGSN